MKERIPYIDAAKGIGILAVIWGHILLSGWSHVIVYAFDIPLFLFISGMVYNSDKYRTFKAFMKSRVKSLLIPYLFFSAVTWLVWIGYRSALRLPIENTWYPLWQTLIAQGSGDFLIHNVPLWFVTCLMGVEVMYYFTVRFNEVVNLSICLLCAFLGYVCVYNGWTRLPWNLEAALSGLLFFAIGNLCANHWGKLCFPAFCRKYKKVCG